MCFRDLTILTASETIDVNGGMNLETLKVNGELKWLNFLLFHSLTFYNKLQYSLLMFFNSIPLVLTFYQFCRIIFLTSVMIPVFLWCQQTFPKAFVKAHMVSLGFPSIFKGSYGFSFKVLTLTSFLFLGSHLSQIFSLSYNTRFFTGFLFLV